MWYYVLSVLRLTASDYLWCPWVNVGFWYARVEHGFWLWSLLRSVRVLTRLPTATVVDDKSICICRCDFWSLRRLSIYGGTTLLNPTKRTFCKILCKAWHYWFWYSFVSFVKIIVWNCLLVFWLCVCIVCFYTRLVRLM